MRRLLMLTLALALPVGITACNENGTGPDDDDLAEATFEASVTGDMTAEFDGTAVFGEATDPETGEDFWVLILTSGDSETTGRTIYFGREGARPGGGTISLANVEDDDPESGEVFALYFDYTQGAYGLFASTGGTLTITHSSSDDMAGSFAIEAAGTVVQGNEAVDVEITITGTFNADNGSVGLPTF